jgi:glycosyltransferase involved in cell wall biosynthesis
MKILCILCRDPFLESDGANYAIRANLRLLSLQHTIKVTGFGVTFDQPMIGSYHSCGSLGIAVNSKISFLLSLLNGKSYTVAKYGTPLAQAKLALILAKEEIDCLWFEQTQSAFVATESGILPAHRPMFSVLRPHNIESDVIRGAINSRAPFAKLLLAIESRLLARAEQRVFRDVDFISAISDTDMNTIRAISTDAACKLILLPVAADRKYEKSFPEQVNIRNSLLFVGNCVWGPNRRALEWVINILAPLMQEKCPEFEIRVVGKGTDAFKSNNILPNTKLLGYVNDIEVEYSRAICAIAPVLDGGGINIKVIESLTRGVPVVGSNFARKGILSEAYFVAETPDEYVASVRHLSDISYTPGKLNNDAFKFSYLSEIAALQAIENIFSQSSSFMNG